MPIETAQLMQSNSQRMRRIQRAAFDAANVPVTTADALGRLQVSNVKVALSQLVGVKRRKFALKVANWIFNICARVSRPAGTGDHKIRSGAALKEHMFDDFPGMVQWHST